MDQYVFETVCQSLQLCKAECEVFAIQLNTTNMTYYYYKGNETSKTEQTIVSMSYCCFVSFCKGNLP